MKIFKGRFLSSGPTAAQKESTSHEIASRKSSLINNLHRFENYPAKLQLKGINYDVGTPYNPQYPTRPNLTKKTIAAEIKYIHSSLNCNAIRIHGDQLDRMTYAAKFASSLGMHVWLSPRFINSSLEETREKTVEYAKQAQGLWKQNNNVVLLIGNELTLDAKGVFIGDTYEKRGGQIGFEIAKSFIPFSVSSATKKLNKFLKGLHQEVSTVFEGEVGYAAGTWEQVDWGVFDTICINKYKDLTNTLRYTTQLRDLRRLGKKIIITEFGCASYDGAQRKGGASYNIVDWSKMTLDGNYKRDEGVQAEYIKDLLTLFEQEGVYGAFVFTFIEPHRAHNPTDPIRDLDISSLGIMKQLPGRIEPKKACQTVASFYASG